MLIKFIKETIIYLIQASIIVAGTVALGAEAYLYYKDVMEEKPFHNYQCDCRCDASSQPFLDWGRGDSEFQVRSFQFLWFNYILEEF